MNLRERLRAMRPAGSPVPAAAPPAAEPAPPSGHGPAPPGARTLRTRAGEAWCIEHVHPFDRPWGTAWLGAVLAVPEAGWRRLCGPGQPPQVLTLRDAAFIDVETTGLERGAGTYAFLIGVGRFVPEGLRVRQFLMCDYDEEVPVLQGLLDELQGARCVVTFNGKTFDWPLLATRAVLNRLHLPELPHLDLLHPARRLWGELVPSCRLVHLEESVLRLVRTGDVPSELIPRIYFEFVRTRDPGPLQPVIDHNRRDVITMAALAGYLGAAMAEPLGASPGGRPLAAAELYGIAQWLSARGELPLAVTCLEEALRRQPAQRVAAACKRLLAGLLKRLDDYPRAAAVWEAMAAEGIQPLEACVELAKYHEHVTKQLAAAREWTLRALDILERRRLLRGLRQEPCAAGHEYTLEALLHRLDRIEAKLRRRACGARLAGF